jgi:hypothetical protein
MDYSELQAFNIYNINFMFIHEFDILRKKTLYLIYYL